MIPSYYLEDVYKEADWITANAQAEVQQQICNVIKEQTEAYILEKANALHLNVDVEIILSNDDIPIPKQVYLRGTAGPFAKQQLTSYIADNIGIQEENQIWI